MQLSWSSRLFYLYLLIDMTPTCAIVARGKIWPQADGVDVQHQEDPGGKGTGFVRYSLDNSGTIRS